MIKTNIIPQVMLLLCILFSLKFSTKHGGSLAVASDDSEAKWVSGWSSSSDWITSRIQNSRIFVTDNGAETTSLDNKITRKRDLAGTSCIKMDKNQKPNSYGKGTRFLPGEFACLGNNKFGLTKNGKIVYMIGSDVVWEQSIEKEHVAANMYMGQGGNLKAYGDGDTKAIWISGSPSNAEWVAKRVPGSRFVMKETGAEIRSPDNKVTWRLDITGTSCIKTDDDQMPNSYGKGTRFLPGEFACLGNNKFGLTKEGKIVYMTGSDVVWEPSTRHAKVATEMYMRQGGNLKAYRGSEAIWISGWPSNPEWVAKRVPGSRFVMKETGAEIRTPDDKYTWRLDITGTSCIEMDDDQIPNSYGKGTRFLPGKFACLGNNKFGLTNEGKIVYMVGIDVAWEPKIEEENTATEMYMGQGGNLKAYHDTKAIWISGWPSNPEWVAKRMPDSILIMTETGAEIRSPNDKVTWRLYMPWIEFLDR